MGYVWTAVAALLLTGCGIAQHAQIHQEANDAASRRDASIAACKQQFPDKAAKRIKCSNAAELDYFLAMERSVGHPGIDLVHLMHAKRLELAEQYDAGKLTEAQYKVAVAQVATDINSQLQARMNNAAVANAAQRQAIAAQQQASAQTMAAGAAIMTGSGSAPAHSTTSCRPLGGTLHCNHF